MPSVTLPDVTDDMKIEDLLAVVGKMKKTLDWLLHNLDADNMPGINSVLGDLETGYSSIIQEIDSITLEVGDINGNVAQLSIRAEEIASIVSSNQDYVTQEFAAIEGQVVQVETTLSNQISQVSQTAAQISTRVSNVETTVTSNYNALTGELDAVWEDVNYNYSEITQLANEISSIVSWTDATGNQVVSKINQTATTITLDAQKIDLLGITHVSRILSLGDGYLTRSSISFNGIGGIEGYGNNLYFSAMEGIVFETITSFSKAVLFDGTVDFSYASVEGLDLVKPMEENGAIMAFYPSNRCYLDYSSSYNALVARDKYGTSLGKIPIVAL